MQSKVTKIVLVKLAAIGDVALACRALNEWFLQFSDSERLPEFHWIIDAALLDLAKDLLEPRAAGRVKFYPADVHALFQGSAKEKTVQAFKLAQVVLRVHPKYLLLLHRDWRYRFLLRPVFTGSVIGVSRETIHELDSYRIALLRLASKLGLSSGAEKDNPPLSLRTPTGQVGLLIGGAQNAKALYAEKRWPHMADLVTQILEKTMKTVVLFGSSADKIAALEIEERHQNSDRIINLVGKTKLSELPERFKELDSFVAIDSGLAHIASQVMTQGHQNVVSLFGPTDPKIWAPVERGRAKVKVLSKNLDCAPCYKNDGQFKTCKFKGDQFQKCMKEISVEQVIREILI